MKETILAIILVLAIVLAIGTGVYFIFMDSSEPPVETAPQTTAAPVITIPTEPSSTQAPTEPTTQTPETTQEPTQEQTSLSESGEVIIVNGVRMSTFVADGDDTVIVGAEEFLAALGLNAEGSAHISDKNRVQLSSDALSLTLDSTTYNTVHNGKLYLPIYEIADALSYPVWVDDEYGGIYITPGARSFEIPAGVNVPVLMYHAVSDNCWGYEELFVSPSSMEEQLKYLVDNGYDPIWFEDLAHVEDYDKPVILTFDDGYDDNYTELFPLLQKYNVKATIFVIGQDFVGIAHKMNEQQIRELSDSGLVSIQSHSYTHSDLSAMDKETLEYEMNQTNKVLARITGKVPYVLCYPSGDYSSLTIEVAKEHYLFGLKMVGGLYNTSVDGPFEVSRYYVARSTDIFTFSSYISSAG
ncbi:MAG: hypothetical protein E7434_04440 [Ruminococcaceae bacterium]|nr:hypothetical protein [Oscillospiraceae bacterium]